jgi:hypothetical protein
MGVLLFPSPTIAQPDNWYLLAQGETLSLSLSLRVTFIDFVSYIHELRIPTPPTSEKEHSVVLNINLARWVPLSVGRLTL